MSNIENSKIRIHYGEKIVEYGLPLGWHLLGNLEVQSLPRIGQREMVEALENPIGKP